LALRDAEIGIETFLLRPLDGLSNSDKRPTCQGNFVSINSLLVIAIKETIGYDVRRSSTGCRSGEKKWYLPEEVKEPEAEIAEQPEAAEAAAPVEAPAIEALREEKVEALMAAPVEEAPVNHEDVSNRAVEKKVP